MEAHWDVVGEKQLLAPSSWLLAASQNIFTCLRSSKDSTKKKAKKFLPLIFADAADKQLLASGR